jgi:hypothetical protein
MFGQGGAPAVDKEFEAKGATDEGLATLERRAGWAMALVALSGVIHALSAAQHVLHGPDDPDDPSLALLLPELVGLVVLVTAAVVFLRWVHRVVVCGHALLAADMAPNFQPREAVWSFFIPIISLWAPYQKLSELSVRLYPDALPEPQPAPEPAPLGEYRSSGRRQPQAAFPWPETVPVGLWWGTWVASNIVSRIRDKAEPAPAALWALDAAVTLAAAALAVIVVRSISLRIRDFARRRSVPLPPAPFYASKL